MKIIFYVFLLFVSSVPCFSQSTDSVSFANKTIVSKARYTDFPCFFLSLFSTNKYLKIKIQGDLLEDISLNKMKLYIIDSNFNIQNMHTIWRGNAIIDDKELSNRKMAKIKKIQNEQFGKEDSILEKKSNHYIIKIPLRGKRKDGISSEGYGYRLDKGTYFLYIECSDDSGYFKTDPIKIIFK